MDYDENTTRDFFDKLFGSIERDICSRCGKTARKGTFYSQGLSFARETVCQSCLISGEEEEPDDQ